MKKISAAGIPLKVFAVLSVLALILLLVPMLKAAEYDVPSADDYANGLSTYRAWSRTGSIFSVLKAAWRHTAGLYRTWQGTFSAIFLFALNPMIFGEQYYPIGPWLILASLLGGIFSLTLTVSRLIFKASYSEGLIIASVWSIISTQFLPRVSQGIYWFTGAVYYTFFFGIALTAFAVLIRFILRKETTKGTGKLIIASLLFLFVGGGNLVTGLTTAVLLATLAAAMFWLKMRDRVKLLAPIFCYMLSFGVNVAAPGNSVRQGHFGQPGLIPAVFDSFREALKGYGKWFTLPVLALILMLIPVFWSIIKKTEMRFPLPGLVTLYFFCLTGVMFYPPIYAMTAHNLQNLGRITNIIFFGMVGLVIFSLFWWMGWLARRGVLSEKLFPAAGKGRFSIIYLLLVLAVFGFGMTRIKWFDTTSLSAFRSYRSGEMGNYWHTYKQRLEILKDPEVKDAVLKRFPYRPYVLFFQELSTNPEDNTIISSWYGKDSVIIH